MAEQKVNMSEDVSEFVLARARIDNELEHEVDTGLWFG